MFFILFILFIFLHEGFLAFQKQRKSNKITGNINFSE